MAMIKKVTLAMSSNTPTHEWAVGRQVLNVLYDAPSLQPERIGRNETEMRKKLPCDVVDDVRSVWAKFDDYIEHHNLVDGLPDELMFPVYWKRMSAIRADGYFNFAAYHKVYEKALPSRAVLRAKYSPKADYLRVFLQWCEIYRPHQGYLHFINDDVVSEERRARDAVSPAGENERRAKDFQNGFLGPLHQEKTYDLGCVNFFSDAWLGDAARQALLASDIDVKPMANGVLIMLAGGIEDMQTSFPNFVQCRRLAKSIVGMERFQIPD